MKLTTSQAKLITRARRQQRIQRIGAVDARVLDVLDEVVRDDEALGRNA